MLKQSAGGVVVFSRKEAPSTTAPRSVSQRTRREFRIRSFRLSSSDAEASGTHASSIAKTHPTAVPEIQEKRMLIIELPTQVPARGSACSQTLNLKRYCAIKTIMVNECTH